MVSVPFRPEKKIQTGKSGPEEGSPEIGESVEPGQHAPEGESCNDRDRHDRPEPGDGT
jgi:hypothetical protein